MRHLNVREQHEQAPGPTDLQALYSLALASCKFVGAGAAILLYAIILHSLAGIVTGSLFKTRTLLLVLAVVLAETAIASAAGMQLGAAWLLTNLFAIQLGYFGGMLARWAVEQAGYSIPPVRIRRPQ